MSCKTPRRWGIVTDPTGYDPYNSLECSYLFDSDQSVALQIKREIFERELANQRERDKLAVAGFYQQQPKQTFVLGEPFA